MKALRRAVFLVFLVCGTFLGHELAYALHYGLLGALVRQTTGVHRYFLPTGELAASAPLGLLSLCLCLVVLISSAVPVRQPHLDVRQVVRWQLVLFLGQIALYVVQECIEASWTGLEPRELGILLVSGLLAQAVIAAVGGWLFALVWTPVAAAIAAYARAGFPWDSLPSPLSLTTGRSAVRRPSKPHRSANSPRAPPPRLLSFGFRRAA